MRIGRLEFGIAKGASWWGYEHASCDCHILDMGKFFIIINGKECCCIACNQFDCICEEE